ASAVAVLVCLLLLVRTVDRNPTWMSTYTVLNTLAQEHPESYRSIRSRAMGLVRVGESEEAGELYDLAAALAPGNYSLLVEAGDFYGRRRSWGKAESLLRRALMANPRSPEGYRVLASQLILQGRGRDGHRLALEGLARSGSDRVLWSLVSESYIAKGDLPAAIRARHAALGADPESSEDWMRLGDLLEATGDTAGAAHARALSEEGGRMEELSR
ncbi:MAG: tetratricopeptide repeat protein, partial [Dehalococcoidia bacterium]